MEKRGISDVVTTVLLILLSILAVIIVWQVIKNNSSPDIETGRITIDLSIKSATVNNNIVAITIQRDPGKGNLIGIAFKFENDHDSYTEIINQSMNEMEYKTYIINLTGKIDNANKVSIAPFVLSPKGRKIVGVIIDSEAITSSTSCIPDCTGKNCGSDGCGGSCGSCSGNCNNGVCENAQTCTPDCYCSGAGQTTLHCIYKLDEDRTLSYADFTSNIWKNALANCPESLPSYYLAMQGTERGLYFIKWGQIDFDTSVHSVQQATVYKWDFDAESCNLVKVYDNWESGHSIAIGSVLATSNKVCLDGYNKLVCSDDGINFNTIIDVPSYYDGWGVTYQPISVAEDKFISIQCDGNLPGFNYGNQKRVCNVYASDDPSNWGAPRISFESIIQKVLQDSGILENKVCCVKEAGSPLHPVLYWFTSAEQCEPSAVIHRYDDVNVCINSVPIGAYLTEPNMWTAVYGVTNIQASKGNGNLILTIRAKAGGLQKDYLIASNMANINTECTEKMNLPNIDCLDGEGNPTTCINPEKVSIGTVISTTAGTLIGGYKGEFSWEESLFDSSCNQILNPFNIELDSYNFDCNKLYFNGNGNLISYDGSFHDTGLSAGNIISYKTTEDSCVLV